MTPKYTPMVQSHTTLEGEITITLRKLVHLNRDSPTGKSTTVSFRWADVQRLQAKRGWTPREFGKQVRKAYAELKTEGFEGKSRVSKQVWARLQKS